MNIPFVTDACSNDILPPFQPCLGSNAAGNEILSRVVEEQSKVEPQNATTRSVANHVSRAPNGRAFNPLQGSQNMGGRSKTGDRQH